MKKLIWIIVITGVVLAFESCYYDKEEYLYPPNNCDTSNISYSNAVAPLIQSQCLSCHSAAVASGGVALETHAQVKTWIDNGRFLAAIKHESSVQMPKGAPKLNNCIILQVESWAKAGAPDN